MPRLKKATHLITICLSLLVLASCGTPPDTADRESSLTLNEASSSSYVSVEASESPKTADNSHLSQMPETVADVYEQGNLSLILDAQVVPVTQEKIYIWDSADFDIADESFQKKMADRLLDGEYSVEANANGGNNYSNDHGVLSFNPDIKHTSYRTTESVELDTTMENFVADEDLDNPYVEQLESILADIGVSHFVPALCAKYGNEETGYFYDIVCQPVIEGLPIVNSGVQPSSLEEVPPYEEVRACIGEDGKLLLLNFRSSQIDDATKKEVEVIKLEDALDILSKEGMAVLSRALSDAQSLTVQMINLAYAHLPNDGGFALTPIWMFGLERVDQEGTISSVTFAVNAVTGEIV